MAFEDFWMSEQAAAPTGASLRFNGGQYLYQYPAPNVVSKINFSFWVKLGRTNTTISPGYIVSNQVGAVPIQSVLYLDSAFFFLPNSNINGNVHTAGVLRDPGAWYHVFATMDNTLAAGSRGQLFINGVNQTGSDTFSGANFGFFSNAGALVIGADAFGTAGRYFDGYISDLFVVANGSILSPTVFGYFDANGVWVPKTFSAAKAAVVAAGGFGPSDFALEFKSANFNTGTLVWADQSGNGNDFTANWNCQVGTSVFGSDIVSDGPAVNNAHLYNLTTGGSSSLPGTSLTPWWWAYNSGAWNNQLPENITIPTSGKWWLEYLGFTGGALVSQALSGFMPVSAARTTTVNIGPGFSVGYGWYNPTTSPSQWYDNGAVSNIGTSLPSGVGVTQTIKLGFAIDCDQATPQVQLWQNAVNSITDSAGWQLMGTKTLSRFDVDSGLVPSFGPNYLNQGPSPFYTNTTVEANGYKQLFATNLPTTSIPDGSTGFQAVLDTGANILTTAQAAFPNGLWWVKDRVNANQHQLVDSINTSASTLSSPAATTGAYAAPTGNSVAWAWATPASGINASTGFSITTGTHGLGQSPQFVIDRQLNVYHASLGSAVGLKLSTTAASAAQAWTVNTTTVSGPAGAGTYYSWAPITGYSSFGSYAGNGSADGPFAYCGFLPAFVLIKCSFTTGNWEIYDNARNTYNPETLALQPNLTNAESTITGIDFLSNGFKIRTTDANFNTSGQTYIYAAFAENPFGGSNVAPVTAR